MFMHQILGLNKKLFNISKSFSIFLKFMASNVKLFTYLFKFLDDDDEEKFVILQPKLSYPIRNLHSASQMR